MTGMILYWKMQNGHDHSFLTYEEQWENDSNIPGGYFLRTGKEVKNQGEYFEYVMENEFTDVEYLEGFEADKKGIKYALENGYINDYDEKTGAFEFI